MTRREKGRTRPGYIVPAETQPSEVECVQVLIPAGEGYKALLAGAIRTLQFWTNYEQDGSHKAAEVARTWKNVNDSYVDYTLCDMVPDEGECITYPSNAWFIDWQPQNPFTQPELVPSGYLFPPFEAVNEGNLLTFVGYEVDDVLTELYRIPIGEFPGIIPDDGLPRFRVNLRGEGVIELHLINIIAGGLALVQVDGLTETIVTVELGLDVVSVPPETDQIIVKELTIEGDDDHFVDVTFVPRFNDETPGVFFGGGLRKVVLCGFDRQCEMLDVRQNEDLPCKLEKSIDGGETWDEWANLQLCPPVIRVNKGKLQWKNPAGGLWADVPEQTDERDDGTFDPPWPDGSVPEGQSAPCLSAENILATYATVFSQMRADISASKYMVAIAAGVSGVLGVFMPIELIATEVLALVASALSLGESGLNDLLSSESLKLLRCNLFCHAGADGSFTAEQYIGFYNQLSDDFSGLKLLVLQHYFDTLGPVGLSRQGKSNLITSADCAGCDCPDDGIWVIDLNFLEDDPTGIYTFQDSAQGGTGQAWISGRGVGGLGIYGMGFNGYLTGTGTTFLTEIETFGYLVNPSGTGPCSVRGASVSSVTGEKHGKSVGSPNIDGPFAGSFSFGGTGIAFSGPDWPGNQYGVWLGRVILRGTGTKPTFSQ
jgi:hypothetical protein